MPHPETNESPLPSGAGAFAFVLHSEPSVDEQKISSPLTDHRQKHLDNGRYTIIVWNERSFRGPIYDET
jgi:hypothetical protein